MELKKIITGAVTILTPITIIIISLVKYVITREEILQILKGFGILLGIFIYFISFVEFFHLCLDDTRK